MRVLFLYLRDDGSAYAHRMAGLRAALDRAGIGTEALTLRDLTFNRPILAHPLNRRRIHQAMRGIDFVHAGGEATFAAVLSSPPPNTKVLYDVHGDTLAEARMLWRYRRVPAHAFQLLQAAITNPVNYRMADYFLAVSEPSIERLQHRHGIDPSHIGMVRNGVDLDTFRPLAPVANPVPVVAYAGRFDPWQGIDNLVDAMAMVTPGTARLMVVGFQPSDDAVRSRMSTQLGDRVQLVDALPRPALVERLAGADLLVIPRTPHTAVEVALPTKFAEYLALGRPLIVCDVDETARLVRAHRCGFVSEPNPQALARTITEAAATSPDELARMGANARALAEREFGWERIGDNYAELLEKWSVE